MASKICPVCKTFTSSSNTTLNAHIDQCLCGESTIKLTANPKVIKHRIEPRKMRSMVDIYATAQYCTLEELDRRNGTNWVSSRSLSAQRIETCAEEKKQKAPVNFEDIKKGSVYADADGTNLRVLSKFSDLSSPVKIGEHPGPRRLMKGDQGRKFLPTDEKKKKREKKQHKLHKCAPESKKFHSTRPHNKSEIIGGIEQNIASEETCEKEALTQRCKTHDQVKSNESGTIGRWVCSKRTALKKKVNGKDDPRHSACTEKKELRGENNESSLGNSYVKRGCLLRSPKSSGTLPSSPKTNMNLSSEPDNEYVEELYLRKRARVSLLDSQACNDRNSSLRLSEGNVKPLRDSNKEHLSSKANPISSLSSQRVEMKRALSSNADSSIVNSKQSSSRHVFSSKTKRFSSLRKNLVSVSQASVPESKFSSKRKCSALKKPRVYHASESDKEAMVWQTGANEQNDSVENMSKVKGRTKMTCHNVTVDRTADLKVRKDRGKIKISRKEDAMDLMGSKSAPEYHEHDDDDKFDSFPGNVLAGTVNGKESAVKEVQLCAKDIVSEPASDMVDEEASMGKSLGVRYHDVAGCSDVQSDSRQFVEVNDGPFRGMKDSRCPVEPILSGGQEIFCTDGEETNIGQNDHMRTELDSNDGPGNCYIEVDPILIPGPPGSFLPSPGRMASEEIEGNSSVTSQVQSSKELPEFADRGSSNSPSATSTISNSDVAKLDTRFLEKLPLGPHSVQDEIRSSIYGATVDAVADNSAPDPSAAYAGAEQLNPVEPTANIMLHERGLFRFRNDQPCCCSWKEGAILGAAALNYPEPTLLQRQTVSSITQLASDKKMNGDKKRELNDCLLMSQVLSSGDLTGGTENVTTYPLGHSPNKPASNSEVKFPINSDSESSSPSKPNPVLRLMGKDLMVVYKDENVVPQLRPSQLPMMKSQGNPLSYTASGVYFGNVQNEDHLSSPPVVSQGPIFKQIQGKTVTQHIDVTFGYSNGYYEAPQRPTHPSRLVLPGRSVPASSCALESVEYVGGCYIPAEKLDVMNRLGRALTCDMEKAVTTTAEQRQNVGSSDQTIKELIVIHDAPESAADLATDAMHAVGVMKGRGSSAGNPGASAEYPVSMTSGFNPRHVNPINGYQPHTSSPYGGSPLVQSANLQMPPPLGETSSPTKWNCVPKGSNLLQKSSFMTNKVILE